MLEVRDLHALYGKSHILQGVNLSVGEGEIVSLLGRNGVGRSTTCKAIMGLVEPVGTVRYRGRDIASLRANLVARAGIGYVPEDRQVFPTLTVRQNLMLGQKRAGAFGRWNIDDVFQLFPNLAARFKVLGWADRKLAGIVLTSVDDEATAGLSELVRAHGCKVTVELVELSRVPNSTDVLGCYVVTLDDDGELVGYERVRRYQRSQTGGEEQ